MSIEYLYTLKSKQNSMRSLCVKVLKALLLLGFLHVDLCLRVHSMKVLLPHNIYHIAGTLMLNSILLTCNWCKCSPINSLDHQESVGVLHWVGLGLIPVDFDQNLKAATVFFVRSQYVCIIQLVFGWHFMVWFQVPVDIWPES